MWEVMFECHKRQVQIISEAQIVSDRAALMQSEYRRQTTINLETELNSLSSSFVKWINAQKSYLQAIDNWLHKCVLMPQKTTKKRRRAPAPKIRNHGPPIYVTCGVWLENLESLPTNAVTDSIKALAVETSRFLPLQEKNRGKNPNHASSTLQKAEDGTDSAVSMLRDDASEDQGSCFDRFRSALLRFLEQLNGYSESTANKYADLDRAIKNSKSNYEQFKYYEQFKSQFQQVHGQS